MTAQIYKGLPENLRPDAARLYWGAFGGKLGRVMGPEPLALKFLAQAIRSDHVFSAIDAQGRLLGLAGFKSPQGSFAGGTMADLRRVYGHFGALWRTGVLSLLERDVENQRFLLDGICVAAEARSQGVGTALLEALFVEAIKRNYSSVRLDVIDTNTRAKALYERMGFIALRTEKLGLLRPIFGFGSCTTMVRPV